MDTLLTIEGLSKSFGPITAVDGIDFSVGRGEMLGFLGPNGAGKSTTMRMVAGYLPPDRGRVSVCGFDVVRRPLDVKRRLLALEGVLPPELPLAQPPAERYLKIKANGSRPAAGKGTVWQEGVSTIRNAHPPPARKARRP